MIGPWVMPYTIVDLAIGIARTFRPKLPYGPFFTMFVVKKFDKFFSRVSIGTLGVG